MKQLSPPTVALLNQMRMDPDLRASLESLRKKMVGVTNGLQHNGVLLSLALDQAGKKSVSPMDAISRLSLAIDDLAANMATSASAWDDMARIQHEAVQGVSGAALAVDAILSNRIVICDGAVAASETARQARFDALIDAGVDKDQAESISAHKNTNALALAVSESAQAKSDRAAIARFFVTHDASDLPESVINFTATPPAPSEGGYRDGVCGVSA